MYAPWNPQRGVVEGVGDAETAGEIAEATFVISSTETNRITGKPNTTYLLCVRSCDMGIEYESCYFKHYDTKSVVMCQSQDHANQSLSIVGWTLLAQDIALSQK